ncbi:F0F1 ATP synthase subunit B [Mycolicibacterium sp. CBMA 361]|uniref:F0F1 ATP synthase subunit B family protein n=1 Tax=Mycolicibacterium sp. CBMA 361 TaxID=2606610 RepID=UPI0012DE8D09|nr:F0F1 ATP synthase subunit B [Mycolicibacterium sp. CBMA 361]MUM35664.1 F0F1 ATP synthase subunit B [Mycolicibacterium sp. CBMA 361]
MGELSATILASGQAAAEGGGGQNFLIPNATFFVVLIIFLIVLGVIGKWVVPPVSKVLVEREEMLAKTAADNRKSAEQVAAAEADYNEVAETLKGADQALSAQRQSTQAELQSSVDNLSQTLASRILGIELASDVKSGGSQ